MTGFRLQLQNSAHRQNGTIGGCTDLDTGLFVAGVDDFASADVNTDMTVVADQITGLSVAVGHTGTGTALLGGSTRQIITEILVHTVDKSRTVCAVGKAGTAVYVGVANKLTGVLGHILAGFTA